MFSHFKKAWRSRAEHRLPNSSDVGAIVACRLLRLLLPTINISPDWSDYYHQILCFGVFHSSLKGIYRPRFDGSRFHGILLFICFGVEVQGANQESHVKINAPLFTPPPIQFLTVSFSSHVMLRYVLTTVGSG